MKKMDHTLLEKKKINFASIFPFVGLLFVLLFFGIGTEGAIFSKRSLNSMLNDSVYVFLGAVGYAFVLAQGNFDMSCGAIMGVACMASAMTAQISPHLALPVGILVGALIGFVNAVVIVKVGLMAFITTLAMQYVCSSIVLIVSDGAVIGAPLEMLGWYTTPLKICLLVVFAVVGYFVFEHTYYGKISKAIGAAPETARQSGAPVTLFRMLPFIIMGAIAGLLGFISLIRTGSATSSTGGTLMLNVMNAALLGGLPFTGGTTSKFRAIIIGTLTVSLLTCGMTILGVGTVDQQIIKALVFLLSIVLSFDRKNLKVIK